MRSAWLVAGLAVVAAATAVAQQAPPIPQQTANTLRAAEGVQSPPATVESIRWLIGHWKGPGLGGVSEEIWAEPAGGVIMGMYRLVQEDKPSFYEFILLAEENGSLVMKLKHFNPDLTGWEEKDGFVTFPLLKLAPNEAYFGGLTYRRIDADTLLIFLALRGQDGNVREEKFELKRQG
jgi:hypothetical protein